MVVSSGNKPLSRETAEIIPFPVGRRHAGEMAKLSELARKLNMTVSGEAWYHEAALRGFDGGRRR